MAQSNLAISRNVHLIAMLGKGFADHLQDGLFVINDEHLLAAAFEFTLWLLSGRIALRTWGTRLGGPGEVNNESGTFAGLAADDDNSAVLFNDAVAEAQAETSAFAHFFGREKRIKDLGKVLFGNARTIVPE